MMIGGWRQISAAHEVFSVHAGGLGQRVPCAGAEGIGGGAGAEAIQAQAGQGFAVGDVRHGFCYGGGERRYSL